MTGSEKSRANLRPFVKGDPRINRTGRPKARASAILRDLITDDDLVAIWTQAIADAKNGDKEARRDVLDRLEGKAVTRSESGEPGDFDDEVLTDVETRALKAALKRVK